MAEFTFWPHPFIIGLYLLAAVAVLASTAVFILGAFRYRTRRSGMTHAVADVLVMAQTVLVAALMARLLENRTDGYVVEAGSFIVARYLVFALLCLAALIEVGLERDPAWLAVIIMAAGTLPVVEEAVRPGFPVVYAVVVVFWLVRGWVCTVIRSHELRTAISVLSIKESIDALPTGLLYYAPDGFILLANRQIIDVLNAVIGQWPHNAHRLLDDLERHEVAPGVTRSRIDDHLLYQLSDGTAWLLTDTALTGHRAQRSERRYHQLTAYNVTEIWAKTAQVQEQNAELARRGDELRQILATIDVIARAEASQRVRDRIHDVLGQRISLLSHAVRQRIDLTALRDFAADLPRTLRGDDPAETTRDSVASLQTMLADIGVDLRFDGAWPPDAELAATLFDVVVEATTNAVRHGYATQVSVTCRRDDQGWRLRVSDNGRSGQSTHSEGGGIRGMRQKMARHGGTLVVEYDPGFTVVARCPDPHDSVEGRKRVTPALTPRVEW